MNVGCWLMLDAYWFQLGLAVAPSYLSKHSSRLPWRYLAYVVNTYNWVTLSKECPLKKKKKRKKSALCSWCGVPSTQAKALTAKVKVSWSSSTRPQDCNIGIPPESAAACLPCSLGSPDCRPPHSRELTRVSPVLSVQAVCVPLGFSEEHGLSRCFCLLFFQFFQWYCVVLRVRAGYFFCCIYSPSVFFFLLLFVNERIFLISVWAADC